MMNYWASLFSDSNIDNPRLEKGQMTWADALELQQRFWTEWSEASQLWLSWWTSAMPPMVWPQMSQFTAPPDKPAKVVPPEIQPEPAVRAKPAARANDAAPKPAASRKHQPAANPRHH